MNDITEKIEVELKNNTKLWQTTLDAISESIFLIDLDHKILQYNRATLDILGKYRHREIINHTCCELVHDTSGPVEWCPVNRMLDSGHREATVRKIKGRWVEISTNPVFNDEGEITGAVHVIADITSRKQAEDALRESEQQYRTILNSLMDPMHVIDKDLRIIFKNPAMTEWLNKLNINSDIVGKTVFEAFPFLVYDKIYNEYDKGFKSGELLITIEASKLFDRNVFTKTLKIPIKSESEVNHIITTLRDITDQKEAEVKLKASEENYKNIINNLMDIIIILDLKGNFQYISPQIYDISGFKREEIIGKNGFKLMHPDDIRNAAEVLKEARDKKKRVYIEYRTIHKDGYYIDVSASGKIVNINGEDRIFAVVRDISDQKRAKQKLKESEEMFRTITEQAFMGILIIQDDKIEYVNNALLHIFEFSNQEIDNWLKDDLLRIIHPEDLQFLRKYRQKLRAGDPNIKPYYSYRVFTKSGKLKWIDQFSKPIIYKGKPAELVIIMDITEKKEAEQELIKLDNLKSELLRRTSHELKTPLVSIKGYSDLLLNVQKEKLDDYVLASIVEIKQGCERLESLIQDILNTAELESGTIQLKKKEEDLSFLIKLSIRELQGLINLRNHTINLKIHDKLVTSFEPEQIHRVISNLINNAIKYTPPDGIIEIKTEIRDNVIILSVKDSGIGITREEKERLFTQFGKVERYGQGLDIISDGSGLGLYISKKVIELHGGKIWVESEGRNKGSTFYFSLPLIIENSGGTIP